MTPSKYPSWIEIAAIAASNFVAHATGNKKFPEYVLERDGDELMGADAQRDFELRAVKEKLDDIEVPSYDQASFEKDRQSINDEFDQIKNRLSYVTLWEYKHRSMGDVSTLAINMSVDGKKLTVMGDAYIGASDGRDLSECIDTFPGSDISAAAQCIAQAIPYLADYQFDPMVENYETGGYSRGDKESFPSSRPKLSW